MSERSTLVILPGWGGTKETWEPFMERARQQYDVHCVELPCFGDEPCPHEIWGVEQYADFVADKIKKLRITNYELRVTLLGHSFGGAVAVQLAADHPELVSKLILSGPAVIRPKFAFKRKVFGAVARIGNVVFSIPPLSLFKNVARRVLYKAADSPDYLNTSGIQREIYKKIIRQDLRHLFSRVQTPTLIVAGTKDTYVPSSYSAKVAQLIPKAELRSIEGGKHGLHIQDPRGLFEIINTYVLSH